MQDRTALVPLDEKLLVRHVAEAVLASAARPVIAVLGHRRDDVTAATNSLNVIAVENLAYRDGLSTSLKAGFAALPNDSEAAIILLGDLLGDMPRVSANFIDRLIEAWRAAERPCAVVPTFAGRRGNPVVLSWALAPKIASLAGDTGANPLLRG